MNGRREARARRMSMEKLGRLKPVFNRTVGRGTDRPSPYPRRPERDWQQSRWAGAFRIIGESGRNLRNIALARLRISLQALDVERQGCRLQKLPVVCPAVHDADL
jgi:hypothetical protein